MIRNIFACLVHESPECIADLVRNLRFLNPSSTVLLYNGGTDPGLLQSGFRFERYGAVVHPYPKPMAWGRLHEFALDCMRFALANIPFDTLTIVDSDQLAMRHGYSERLGAAAASHSKAGLFSNVPEVLPPSSQIGPAPVAFQELDLWRPFLRRFPDGERKFPHWSFWPSTVFTADAARDLTQLFDSDAELQHILSRSRIWATEEIVLPTLTALLGYEIAAKPASGDFVKYRAAYRPEDIETAFLRDDVYWIHPVPRRYEDPMRTRIRKFFGDYDRFEPCADAPQAKQADGMPLSVPILERMRKIEGWLDDEEGDLLIAAATRAVDLLPPGFPVVEAGSFCGRATVVLASVIKSLRSQSVVFAIDSHDGRVGALDQGLKTFGPTLDRFRRNISENGLTDVVETIQSRPAEAPWNRAIGFLLIDGLHDYPSVARDFHHFEGWIVPGGYVAFHDYADYFPGVRSFVNELMAENRYRKVAIAKSLIVLRKEVSQGLAAQEDVSPAAFTPETGAAPAIPVNLPSLPHSIRRQPFVSCIMPTADRRAFIPQAIRYFLRQDYSACELIVVDDGSDCIADLIPDLESVRYIRLPDRRSMGAKHNLACEVARGDVIVHLDDDDWNAPWRVSYQVDQLSRRSSQSLCGLSRVLFYQPAGERAWEYVYPMTGRPWVYGATFCYRKRFWEQHRIPDMNEGADTTYVWNLDGADVFALENHRFLVATVHSNNTSPKRTNTTGWQSRSSLEIRGVVDEDGWSFYEKLRSVDKRNEIERNAGFT
jgi:Glycosyl transferase family 2/Methyltransferase domain